MGETLSFAPRKAIKSQALADFLAEWVDTQLSTAPIQAKLWTMYFDGSLMKTEAGAGLLFISPLGKHVRYVIRLHFDCSNSGQTLDHVLRWVAYENRGRCWLALHLAPRETCALRDTPPFSGVKQHGRVRGLG